MYSVHSIPDWFLLHSWNQFLAPSRLLKYPIYIQVLFGTTILYDASLYYFHKEGSETGRKLSGLCIKVVYEFCSTYLYYLHHGRWLSGLCILYYFIRIGNSSETVWTLPTCIICIMTGDCLDSASLYYFHKDRKLCRKLSWICLPVLIASWSMTFVTLPACIICIRVVKCLDSANLYYLH